MPIFEYECDICGNKTEVIILSANKEIEDAVECTQCKTKTAKRVISRSSFTLNGGGWAKTNYS